MEVKKRIEYFLNIVVQIKTDEYKRLEQQVVNSRVDIKKKKKKPYEDNFKTSLSNLDELIGVHKPTKDKCGFGMEVGEIYKVMQNSNIIDNQKTQD